MFYISTGEFSVKSNLRPSLQFCVHVYRCIGHAIILYTTEQIIKPFGE